MRNEKIQNILGDLQSSKKEAPIFYQQANLYYYNIPNEKFAKKGGIE